MDILHDLIGYTPNSATLDHYLLTVKHQHTNASNKEASLRAAVILQRHKMIEYENTAKDMNLCELSAALPYISTWEQRVYRDHIMEHLYQQLPATTLSHVLPMLQKINTDQFAKELPIIINEYIN